MIIWSGWGILTFVYFLATGLAGIALPASLADSPSSDEWIATARWLLPAAALLMAAANWFTGVYFNKIRPQQTIDEEIPRLRAQMYQAVQNGTFSMGPDHPRPASVGEAQGQADAQLRYVEARARQSMNRHRFFFIPMQWWSIGILAFGILVPILLG